MLNILIVFATRDGQSAKIAVRVAGVLRRRGHGAELVDAARAPAEFHLDAYDAAILFAPVRGGRYPRSISRFACRHRDWLETVPSAFFSVGLGIVRSAADAATPTGREEMLASVGRFGVSAGWTPTRTELVAGGLPYTAHGRLVRWWMRRGPAARRGDTDPSRDYEYTDWEALERRASSFAALVEERTQARRWAASDRARSVEPVLSTGAS